MRGNMFRTQTNPNAEKPTTNAPVRITSGPVIASTRTVWPERDHDSHWNRIPTQASGNVPRSALGPSPHGAAPSSVWAMTQTERSPDVRNLGAGSVAVVTAGDRHGPVRGLIYAAVASALALAACSGSGSSAAKPRESQPRIIACVPSGYGNGVAVLRLVAVGPRPTRSLPGTLYLSRPQDSRVLCSARVTANQLAEFLVAPSAYIATGHSPRYNKGTTECRAKQPLNVFPKSSARVVEVVCDEL